MGDRLKATPVTIQGNTTQKKYEPAIHAQMRPEFTIKIYEKYKITPASNCLANVTGEY
jgi:hypothetical protein